MYILLRRSRVGTLRLIVPLLVCTALVVGGALGGTGAGRVFVPILAVFVVLGWAHIACAFVVPKSYALEIDDNGFRTYDVRGRVRRSCLWAELQMLFVLPGSRRLVGWLCSDGASGASKRQKRYGMPMDGCTQDGYGRRADEVLQILADARERAGVGQRAGFSEVSEIPAL